MPVFLAPFFFLIPGLGLLWFAAHLAFSPAQLLRDGLRARGTVIENVRHRNSYSPKVSFVAGDGQSHEFTSPLSSGQPSFRVGETVEVLYSASAPEDGVINSFYQLWGPALLVGGFGAVLTLAAAAVLQSILRG
jgi:hypothetical protein